MKTLKVEAVYFMNYETFVDVVRPPRANMSEQTLAIWSTFPIWNTIGSVRMRRSEGSDDPSLSL
jgi:hypothetical protein